MQSCCFTGWSCIRLPLSDVCLSWGPGVKLLCVQGNARLVEGLIRKLRLHKPTIVGHSQGALVAMELYRRCALTACVTSNIFHGCWRALQLQGLPQAAERAASPGRILNSRPDRRQ